MSVGKISMTAALRGHDVHLRFSVRANQSTVARPPPYDPRPSQFPPPAAPADVGSYLSRSFNSNVIVFMAVLLFALVVAAFINTIARCMLRRRRRSQEAAAVEESGTATMRENGLDKSEIAALPVVAYGAAGAGAVECVVCLCEFVAGEQLRLLPACQHAFHLACIDKWLLTHTSCPVCRRGVLAAADFNDSSDDDDPDCADAATSDRSGTRAATRVGATSARFGSARIAHVPSDVEIEAGQAEGTDQASAGGASTSRPKRSLASILSAEAMANIIIHGVGSRRFALRIQGPV